MTLATLQTGEDGATVLLSGDWTLAGLPRPVARFDRQLAQAAGRATGWDLSAVDRLDSAGALLLWRCWGRRLPERLTVGAHRRVIDRLAALPAADDLVAPRARWSLLEAPGRGVLWLWQNFVGLTALTGQLLLDGLHVLARPSTMPWREFSATLYRAGTQALPVTALVGFLIGVVLSYLSALQLRNFGADAFIVNILGIGIIREFAPVLVAILVAGRSGSAITAQLGAMRVTEEIDALATFGVSRSLRLVLPRVLALGVAVPLLVVWTSIAGLIGGMVSAQLQLGLDLAFFVETLARVVPPANLWLAGAKGLTFGVSIALVACHFGQLVKPNTNSLSVNTTASVVTSITTVIVLDAIFAIFTRGIGNPLD
jgi:phospholipid/cholesterol/gamma-HCH transport system permease protein